MTEIKKCEFCGRSEMETAMGFNNGKGICLNCALMIANRFEVFSKTKGHEGLSQQIELFYQENPSPYKMNYSGHAHATHHGFVRTKPKEMKDYLDDYVIGQSDAKLALAVAVDNHYKRINMENSDVEKSNILMVGPTGSGKTLLVKTLAKKLNVPIAICDATSLTETGFVGDDVESVLEKLLLNADGDIGAAERGIVYIDEIDKIGRDNANSTSQASKEGVQQDLLKIIEGTRVSISNKAMGSGITGGNGGENGGGNGRAGSRGESQVEIDTSNILFICGGSFEGMRIDQDSKAHKICGFSAQTKKEEIPACNDTEDSKDYGMIREFLGRLPVVIHLEKLTVEDILKVLTEPKNSIISQYQKLFEVDGVHLDFSSDALKVIADNAYKKNTGARGIRSIIENILMDLMYEIPSDDELISCQIEKK